MIRKKSLVEEDWIPFLAVFITLKAYYMDGLISRKVGKLVAVKRIQRTEVIIGDKSAIHREVETMEKAKHHPNTQRRSGTLF